MFFLVARLQPPFHCSSSFCATLPPKSLPWEPSRESPFQVVPCPLQILSSTVRSAPSSLPLTYQAGTSTTIHRLKSLFLSAQILQKTFNRLSPVYRFILFRSGLYPGLFSEEWTAVQTVHLTLGLLQLGIFGGPYILMPTGSQKEREIQSGVTMKRFARKDPLQRNGQDQGIKQEMLRHRGTRTNGSCCLLRPKWEMEETVP